MQWQCVLVEGVPSSRAREGRRWRWGYLKAGTERVAYARNTHHLGIIFKHPLLLLVVERTPQSNHFLKPSSLDYDTNKVV